MTGNTDMHLLVADTINKKVGAFSENQSSASGVTTICLMQSDISFA
jgi:hypothetical protein